MSLGSVIESTVLPPPLNLIWDDVISPILHSSIVTGAMTMVEDAVIGLLTTVINNTIGYLSPTMGNILVAALDALIT